MIFNSSRTSDITASTAQLSWLQLLKTWQKVSVSQFPSLPFRMATVTCQDIPRFPNQSVWLSRYFRGINFIAQSWTRRTDVSSRPSSMPNLALSWFTERNRWDFHAFTSRFALSVKKVSSSLTSFETSSGPITVFSITFSISSMTTASPLHWLQQSLWWWEQVDW